MRLAPGSVSPVNERTRQFCGWAAAVDAAAGDGTQVGPTTSAAITGGPPLAGSDCAASTIEVGTVSRLTSVIASVVSPAGTVITGPGEAALPGTSQSASLVTCR